MKAPPARKGEKVVKRLTWLTDYCSSPGGGVKDWPDFFADAG